MALRKKGQSTLLPVKEIIDKKQSIVKHILNIIFVTTFIPLYGQNHIIPIVYLGDKGYTNIDSALIEPQNVEALWFGAYPDSTKNKYIREIEARRNEFANLKYLYFTYDCNIDTIPDAFLLLPSLCVISSIGVPTLYPNGDKSVGQNIWGLNISCPENSDENEWQNNIYAFKSIRVLSLSFPRSVEITENINNLNNIEILNLFSRGDITYPKINNRLSKLKVFDISHCLTCRSFPDSLPQSIEEINIRYTRVSKLPDNIRSLQNLKYLDIGHSKIAEFPKDFNFNQLEYFDAPGDLFTPGEWEEIQKKVKGTVVIGSDRTIKKGGCSPPKRQK